jgi:hypothetical protein
MKKNYIAEIVNIMQSNSESPSFIVGYLQAVIDGFQQDAEHGVITPQRLLEEMQMRLDLARATTKTKGTLTNEH